MGWERYAENGFENHEKIVENIYGYSNTLCSPGVLSGSAQNPSNMQ
jgi:hypothetical protein